MDKRVDKTVEKVEYIVVDKVVVMIVEKWWTRWCVR
jgi:hypothetical protein